MKKAVLWLLCVTVLAGVLLVAPAFAANEATPFVTTAATTPDQVLSALSTASYVKLGADMELELAGQTLCVDLAGHNLTVNGSGKVAAFDSANDTYDHTLCGTLSCNGTVTWETDYAAPNGNRYIAVGEGNRATLHRLEARLTGAVLRTACAGIYYKALFSCDRLIQQDVDSCGVAVSTKSIPTADFNANGVLYTVLDASEFTSGAAVNSGIVTDILNTEPEMNNDVSLDTKIYARVYINIGGQKYMGDTYTANSMMELMKNVDGRFDALNESTRGQLNDFYDNWKNQGVSWNFDKIGAAKPDYNADLKLDPSTNEAYCPVCDATVTWEPLTNSSTMLVAKNGKHYYLAEEIVFEGSGSGVYAYMQAPTSTGHTACLHLNNQKLTATKLPAFHGSNGVLNIMGEGTVIGTQTSSSIGRGAAIQTNNKIKTNAVNLYGGIYRKSDNSTANAAVVGIRAGGGGVFVYEGATLDAAGSYAVCVETPDNVDQRLGLYGCKVNGDVLFQEPDNAYWMRTEFDNCTINGTVTLAKQSSTLLSGKLDIGKLIVPQYGRITTAVLKSGTVIGLEADGIFTTPVDNLSQYKTFFVPADTNKKVIVRDKALACGYDYTSDLQFAEGTTEAFCPVCKKTVTWTALTDDSKITLAPNSHYYLADHLTYSGTGDAFLNANYATEKSCIHLNGHNLTATNTRVLYGGSSVNNIMGTGIVSGKVNDKYGPGSTIQANNTNSRNQINLYSGTYRQNADAAAGEYVINMHDAGGKVTLYEDVIVEANENGKALRIGKADGNHSRGRIYGATIKGNIELVGAVGTNETELTLHNATVTGTVNADGKNTVNLSGVLKVGKLDLDAASVANLDGLWDGTDITVERAGVFAAKNTAADSYIQYFTAANIRDKIVSKDGALAYKTNYTSKLQLDSEDKAYCPVCEQDVTWTAISDTSDKINLTSGHYYLAKDLTFTIDTNSSGGNVLGPDTGNKACLHLNGHNITATKCSAMYVRGGWLNVLGSGTVSGVNKNANYGGAVHTNNKNANNGLALYSGTFAKYQPSGNNAVIGMQSAGATVEVYEDVVIDGAGGLAINMGSNTNRKALVRLIDATINGNIKMAGAGSADYVSQLEGVNATILGTLSVEGTNTIDFSGLTKIDSLVIAPGSLVGFSNMLPGSSIKVDATGIFTTPMENPEEWKQYFSYIADGNKEMLIRNNSLFLGTQAEVPAAEQNDIDVLTAAYANRVAKFGDMHNHTDAGPTADGRFSLVKFKERMGLLGMSFSTIVDHKQVAHMYHDDWIRESTDDTDIVFVGGSEPSGKTTDGGSGSFHYNMLVNDPAALLSIVEGTSNYTVTKRPYADFNSGYEPNGTQNKNGTYNPTEYSKDPKGILATWDYPSFKVAEFKTLTEKIYNAGGLLVHVHPKYPGYMSSTNPLHYFFGEEAGSADAVAMGLEVHIPDNDNYKPSYVYNEEAYNLWIDLLKAGKKVYATYGNDNHRLPSADSLTAIYATQKANSDEYMSYMHDGNFAPGWVGIRMQIGDTSMGGTTEFDGQRVIFSVGDMYVNDYADEYIPGIDGVPVKGTWNPSYNPDNKYVVQVYDDGGLIMQSEVDPGQMNYYAFDADPEAKYYRVVVWDMTQGYRCGIGNPIWNTK